MTSLTLRLLPEDVDYKGTAKLTWVADTPEEEQIEVQAVEYTYIITKPYVPKGEDFADHVNPHSRHELAMLGAGTLADLKQGEIVQLHRKGFFICDSPAQKLLKRPLVLVYIPDGHEKHFIADRAPEGQSVTAEEYAAAEHEIAAKKAIVLQLRKGKADKADVRAAEAQVKAMLHALSQMRVIGSETDTATPAVAHAAAAAGSTATVAVDAAKGASSALAATAAPDVAAAAAVGGNATAAALQAQITAQGEEVRKLKAAKAGKDAITAQVQVLLKLKEQYTALTGEAPPAASAPASKGASKGSKKSAAAQPAQAAAGKKAEPKAEMTPVTVAAASAPATGGDAAALEAQVATQGEAVRSLKGAKADKAAIDAAVAVLLDLKKQYTALTGAAPAAAAAPRSQKKAKAPAAEGETKDKKEKKDKKDKKDKKEKAAEGESWRVGIGRKEEEKKKVG